MEATIYAVAADYSLMQSTIFVVTTKLFTSVRDRTAAVEVSIGDGITVTEKFDAYADLIFNIAYRMY